jgi:predicted negative regulator of RcsB-dependent stress response
VVALAHISRKELKSDAFRDTIEHGAEAVYSHQQLTTWILIAVIVVAGSVLAWRIYSQRQNAAAAADFASAMDTFGGRVITAGQPPAQPGETTFPDEQTKYAAAANKFGALAAKYPHTDDGVLAKYFAAISYIHANKNDDAKRLLTQLTTEKDPNLAALGTYQLAQLDEQNNQGDAAVKLYQQLIDHPAVMVPKSVAMLALAEHYSQTDPTQAAKLFNQIKTDYPDTPIADQADQGLSMLPGKS